MKGVRVTLVSTKLFYETLEPSVFLDLNDASTQSYGLDISPRYSISTCGPEPIHIVSSFPKNNDTATPARHGYGNSTEP